jgi:hypothetical protein
MAKGNPRIRVTEKVLPLASFLSDLDRAGLLTRDRIAAIWASAGEPVTPVLPMSEKELANFS